MPFSRTFVNIAGTPDTPFGVTALTTVPSDKIALDANTESVTIISAVRLAAPDDPTTQATPVVLTFFFSLDGEAAIEAASFTIGAAVGVTSFTTWDVPRVAQTAWATLAGGSGNGAFWWAQAGVLSRS